MFDILNADNKIAEIEVSGNRITGIKLLINPPKYFIDFEQFLINRMYDSNRSNILNLERIARIRNLEDNIRLTKCISCNDTIWAKESNDKTTWSEINPYKNRFNRIISNIALDNDYNGGYVKSPSPDYRIDGSIDKCWKRIDGKIKLYKTNGECYSGLAGLRTYCEYYASQVADKLISNKNQFVHYDICVNITNDGFRKPYAISDSFTNEDTGLIKIEDTKYKYIDTIKLLDIFKGYNNELFREMLLLDSIIMNVDRHFGNYGFLIDNKTFKIIGLAPIYDNDCSLGWNISLQNNSIQEGYRILANENYPKTMNCSWVEQGKLVLNQDLRARLLKMYPFKFERLKDIIDVNKDRIDFMEFIVNNQIREILS